MQTGESVKRKTIFSGIQPTGNLTLGNYIGALRNFKLLEDEYDCLYSIVDMHALTVRQDAPELRKACLRVMSLFLAVGLDPKKSLIYFQSHVPAHAELSGFELYTDMGELSLTHSRTSPGPRRNINTGLCTYPARWRRTSFYTRRMVPSARTRRAPGPDSDVPSASRRVRAGIHVPEAYIPKVGGRVNEPAGAHRKMSKSDPEDTYIAMLDARRHPQKASPRGHRLRRRGALRPRGEAGRLQL